jgi:hypothetical protein
MNSQNKISILEIFRGIITSCLSYLLLAFLNISNEDLYNWDVSMIFGKGGWLNILALVLLCFWILSVGIWLLSIIIRIIK